MFFNIIYKEKTCFYYFLQSKRYAQNVRNTQCPYWQDKNFINPNRDEIVSRGYIQTLQSGLRPGFSHNLCCVLLLYVRE